MKINTVRLRLMLGWLAMLLPWIVSILTGGIPQSISATYYTNASTVFMIILGASCILLISYKGYDKIDDILLTASGISGLGICLFPCCAKQDVVGTFNLNPNTSNAIHCTCAIVFFILLSINSAFLFTKGSGTPTRCKKARNVIYYICAGGMLGSFAILLIPDFNCQVWLTEMIALTFFGVSFLTKANVYRILFAELS